MTRTVPAAIAAQFTAGKSTLAKCLRLDLRDGTTLGLTDHDQSLSVNLGDGAVTYRADVGALPSDVSLALGLDADNVEVVGPIGSTVTRQALLGGRFLRARARLFDANWANTTQYVPLLAGKVAEARVDGGSFRLQIRSSADALNQTIGRVLSPYCSWDFGVDDPPTSRCQATPEVWSAEVVAVTDAMRFQISIGSPGPSFGGEAINGLVEFTSGALAGTLPVEVFSLSGSPLDTLELYQPLVEAPEVGDTLTITQGCDKRRDTCKGYGQILNFGGFPDLVGTDAYVKFPRPAT